MKNGHLAYFCIKKIALGEQWLTHRVQYIEAELDKCKYKGESGTWFLSKYCERMVNLFTQSDELVPLGYHGYDDKTPVAVDKFIAGIQGSMKPKYAPVKVFIRENNCTDLTEAIRKMKNHLLDNPGLQVKKGIGISVPSGPHDYGALNPHCADRVRVMQTFSSVRCLTRMTVIAQANRGASEVLSMVDI